MHYSTHNTDYNHETCGALNAHLEYTVESLKLEAGSDVFHRILKRHADDVANGHIHLYHITDHHGVDFGMWAGFDEEDAFACMQHTYGVFTSFPTFDEEEIS